MIDTSVLRSLAQKEIDSRGTGEDRNRCIFCGTDIAKSTANLFKATTPETIIEMCDELDQLRGAKP